VTGPASSSDVLAAGANANTHTPLGEKPSLRGVSHFYACFVAAALGTISVVTAPPGTATVAAAIYATALVVMFGASALYHRPAWSPAQAARFLKLDHTAIFLMIAGTSTPIALLAIDGTLGTIVLVLVWTIAAAGIVFEWLPVGATRGYVTTVYLTLGWIGVLGLEGLWESTGIEGVLLVAGGGVLYTVGAVVHAARRPDPWPRVFGYHELFHAFVIAAALLHWWAIQFLVLPLGA
jgi:hemolysin III